MSKQTTVRVILLAGATALAWSLGAVASGAWRAPASTPGNPVAFTAEFVVKTYDAANRELSSSWDLLARRGDGSVVMMRKNVNNESAEIRRIWNIRERRSISVDPLTRSLLTSDLSAPEIAYLAAPGANCREHNPHLKPTGERAQILGFDTVHLSGQPPGADFRVDRWSAPALNCFVMREELTSPAFRQVRSTLEVRLGEPDPSLFEIPAGYVERPPSEIMALAAARRARRPDARAALQLDSIYWNRRAR